MSQSQEYQKAMQLSYANQSGGITIPADQLDNIVTIPLGFQPLGISVHSGRHVAITAYFEPAVCLASIRQDQQGLHFEGSWIRGVQHGTESVRLFSGKPTFSDSNRAQAVCWMPDGRLVVTRNGERELFFLRPPSVAGQKWTLDERKHLPGGDNWMVQSLKYDQDARMYWSVEADRAECKKTQIVVYDTELLDNTGDAIKDNLTGYLYGIDRRLEDQICHVVTDFRCPLPAGIYRHDNLSIPVVPGVNGTGIAFLTDGSALVSQYGQGASGFFNGQPGALVYVPAKFFDNK